MQSGGVPAVSRDTSQRSSSQTPYPRARAHPPELMFKLPSPFKLYVAAVIACGLAALAWTVVHQTPDVVADAPLLLWVLFGCVVIGELLPINVVLRGQEGE